VTRAFGAHQNEPNFSAASRISDPISFLPTWRSGCGERR
jgi:hypothetical protein